MVGGLVHHRGGGGVVSVPHVGGESLRKGGGLMPQRNSRGRFVKGKGRKTKKKVKRKSHRRKKLFGFL